MSRHRLVAPSTPHTEASNGCKFAGESYKALATLAAAGGGIR
eukprot:CAMPEP_0183350156 /NCGR_PEP_ID=MMETSP0164_2-20130417/17170_1 /TAXON_ID=221442 /ORGANISM="Coccolithus pelagicus ssp braarudi, Strain PLY182g" /LENGTH=41 /DNA_ID= /DNA_START= /DNA_END= /DNA_ORIENTATION=